MFKSKKNNIAFIGGRGAGKSKLSRKFSKLSDRALFSTDSLISFEAGGISIARLVEKEGWQTFRNREYKILKKLCQMDGVIIDCGGGIVVEAPTKGQSAESFSERKVKLLKSCAQVVYIKRDLSWLLQYQPSAQRPDLIGSYQETIERRLSWYEECANLTLDMGKLAFDEALSLLLEEYGKIE